MYMKQGATSQVELLNAGQVGPAHPARFEPTGTGFFLFFLFLGGVKHIANQGRVF